MLFKCKNDIYAFNKDKEYIGEETETKNAYRFIDDEGEKFIFFKTDINLKEYFELVTANKQGEFKMNIREVIPSIKKDQEYKCENFIIKCLDNETIEIKNMDTGHVFGFLKDDEFIKVEKPVSFDEVLNSDKKCRVEHELMKEIFEDTNDYTGDYYIKQNLNHFKNGEYLKLEDILLIIGRFTCSEEIKDIIKNGKWFLEE